MQTMISIGVLLLRLPLTCRSSSVAFRPLYHRIDILPTFFRSLFQTSSVDFTRS